MTRSDYLRSEAKRTGVPGLAEALRKRASREQLQDFIAESNRIEGIFEIAPGEIQVYEKFLFLDEVRVVDMERFVKAVADKPLRRKEGQNVRVGSHYYPPEGGPHIEKALESLLVSIHNYELDSYEAHVEYEKLHPFLDGNGRSGRVLWAWMMGQEDKQPFALPFLHRFYYQTLEYSA